MIDELQKIVKDLLPNSPINFFTILPEKSNIKRICDVSVPILNDLLIREQLIEQAIQNYTAVTYADYKIELLSMCKVVKDTFNLSDKDTLDRVNSIMSFELSGEGDLEFITAYQDDIRELTLSKLKKLNYEYLFPFYFIFNRTGLSLDLTLLSSKEYANLLEFIESERNQPVLEQLDDPIDIKKP